MKPCLNQLPADAASRLQQLGHADIVVGIPSYNNARTIGHVVQAVQVGLAKYFPSARAVIVNSDGGSSDGTPEIVRTLRMPAVEVVLTAHPETPIHKMSVPYHGIPGKGSAFRCIFQVADCLEADAYAVVDSDLRSITPEWVQLLLAPILLQQYDYVAPFYLRHKYDGDDHQQHRVSADARALWAARAPADRRRLRRREPPDRPFSEPQRLGERRRAIRHRHLDDHDGDLRRLSRVPVFSRRQASRCEGSRHGPERHARPGRGHAVHVDGDVRARLGPDPGVAGNGRSSGFHLPWVSSR